MYVYSPQLTDTLMQSKKIIKSEEINGGKKERGKQNKIHNSDTNTVTLSLVFLKVIQYWTSASSEVFV